MRLRFWTIGAALAATLFAAAFAVGYANPAVPAGGATSHHNSTQSAFCSINTRLIATPP